MFNKEGIPFFTVIIPFLTILFMSFFIISYYSKVSNENFEQDLIEYKKIYNIDDKIKYNLFIEKKYEIYKKRKADFENFVLVLTSVIFIFMGLFSLLMMYIINDVVKKYKNQVQSKENKLQKLNSTLIYKVEKGIEEGKKKDKAILQQSRLARMGTMISMIAHQWRQPLTELSGVLMELETATRFKKVNDKHILTSLGKSDKIIEFMSNTIDDFRNFYKPDKKKEIFSVLDSCKKAIILTNASLEDSNIKLNLKVKNNVEVLGYPNEYAQVILNLIINAADVLVEKKIKNPKISIIINKKINKSFVTIKDNAGGIEEENMDVIFDPYYTTKDSSTGTGLGLYVSKLIIENNMQGQLNVSNDKNGAVFNIILMGK